MSEDGSIRAWYEGDCKHGVVPNRMECRMNGSWVEVETRAIRPDDNFDLLSCDGIAHSPCDGWRGVATTVEARGLCGFPGGPEKFDRITAGI